MAALMGGKKAIGIIVMIINIGKRRGKLMTSDGEW
jgi:hypothetical protein